MLLKYLIINSNNMELLSHLEVDGTNGTMDGEETGTQHGDGTESGIEMKMEDIEETDDHNAH